MLETAQRIEYPRKGDLPRRRFDRKIFEDFLESVPTVEDLNMGREEKEESFRASSFMDDLESFKTILLHFQELSKVEQEAVLARSDTMLKEAHRWSHISSTRDIQTDLRKMIAQAHSAMHSQPKLKIVRVQKFS
jgi:hypothetical protein